MQETRAKILVWARSIDVVRLEMLFPPDFAITPLATALGAPHSGSKRCGSLNVKSQTSKRRPGSLTVLFVTAAGNADSANQFAFVEQRKAATDGH